MPVPPSPPPGAGLRRVPGLRREEVAHLAGISVDYYVRFEQGRCPSVSDALVDSVARILRLTPTERLYLYDIARAPSTPAPADDQQVSNGVRLLLDNLSTPAFVLGRPLDLLAVNGPARALHPGLETDGNYLRWLMLDTASRTLCADWELAAREAIAMLRLNAARHPHDPTLATLINQLARASSEFRRIWDTHEVDVGRNGKRRYHHPVAGEIVLHSERLDIMHAPDQALFTYSVIPGSSSDAALRKLAPTTNPASSTQAAAPAIPGMVPLWPDTHTAATTPGSRAEVGRPVGQPAA